MLCLWLKGQRAVGATVEVIVRRKPEGEEEGSVLVNLLRLLLELAVQIVNLLRSEANCPLQ